MTQERYYPVAVKSVIITGGNSGLGFECAKTIAHANQDWHIILACRTPQKGTQAVEAIIQATGNQNVSFLPLDLASLASVRQFVSEYEAKKLPPLQGLLCNAGLVADDKLDYTKDGFEVAFGVNYLGHFLLTNLLLSRLVEPARIIIVSSNTHNPATRDGQLVGKAVFLGVEQLAHPDSASKLSGGQRYTTSKLCTLLFAYELDRILRKKARQITVNAFDPGASPGTNLGGGKGVRKVILGSWVGKLLLRLLGVVSSTPEKSGAAMARLLLDTRLKHVSGKYFQIDTEIASSADSYNKTMARELWADSVKLTQL